MGKVNETIVYSIETKWDAKSKKQLDLLQQEAVKTEKAVGNMANSTQKAGKSTRSAGYAAQNASYQIADFFVMIQGGISPLRSLTTQLPQLLAGFGPLGAVMGAVAAVGASVWVAFDNMGESAGAAAKRVKAFGDAIEGLNGTSDGSLAQFRTALKGANAEMQELIELQYEQAGFAANTALAAATKEFDLYVQGLSDASIATGLFNSQLGSIGENQLAIKNIKDNFGAVSDAVAQEIIDLQKSFADGAINGVDFAKAISQLGKDGLIDSEITNRVLDAVQALESAKKTADELNGKLYADRPSIGVIDQEAIDEANRLISGVTKEVEAYYDTLFNLESVRFEIGEEAFQEAFAALQAKWDANISNVLPPIEVNAEASKAEQEIAEFAASIKRSIDPMIAFREQEFLIKQALKNGEITANQATAALKALNDETLKEIDVRNKRLKALKATGAALLASVDPVRAYRIEVLEAKAALAAINATGPQTAAVIDKITDSYLQFVEVTAKRKPENPLEQFDLQGYQGVIQDLKSGIEGFGDSFADSILDATENGMESFKKFADFVIKEIARIALKNLVIQPLVNSLTNLFPTGAIAPTATIGVVETAGGSSAARAESVNTAAITGGAMMAKPESSQKGINVNVNNYGNDEVQVQERKTSRGLEIDVLIKSAVNKGLAGGDFDNAMRASYGARRLAY